MPGEEAQSLLNKYKSAIGRVFRRTGSESKPVLIPGTCFLIAPDLAVTCHHVVHSNDSPIENLSVVFEGDPEARISAVAYKTLGIGRDLTILRLLRSVTHTPLPCGFVEAWGEQFVTYGYPVAHGGTGVSVAGQIMGPTTILRNDNVFSRTEV